MRTLKLAVLGLVMTLSSIGTAAAVPPPDADFNHVVPEPTTLVLLATGIGVGAAALFRRRK
jgi:hypothetical protein